MKITMRAITWTAPLISLLAGYCTASATSGPNINDITPIAMSITPPLDGLLAFQVPLDKSFAIDEDSALYRDHEMAVWGTRMFGREHDIARASFTGGLPDTICMFCLEEGRTGSGFRAFVGECRDKPLGVPIRAGQATHAEGAVGVYCLKFLKRSWLETYRNLQE